MKRHIFYTFCYASVLIVLLGGAVHVHPATFNVTTYQDNMDGSLRSAITAANSNGEDDTIYLPAGTYILSGAPDDDNNSGGDLDIDNDHSITIIGDDRETTIIDGNEADRVLHVLNGTVSIAGVTIRNGKARDGEAVAEYGADGGGIYNGSILNLSGCSIENNTCGSGYEGYFHWSYVNCPGGGRFRRRNL